jgi:hypothetical protein
MASWWLFTEPKTYAKKNVYNTACRVWLTKQWNVQLNLRRYGPVTGLYVMQQEETEERVFFVVKDPAAEATDAPQP